VVVDKIQSSAEENWEQLKKAGGILRMRLKKLL
jgi:hypothetical protein